MKKILALVSSVVFAGSAYAAAPAADAVKPMQLTLAVVNVQQVLQQSPKVTDLNAKLQSEFKPRQEKLIADQKALQDEVDKFKKDSATMSDKDKESMQKKVADDQAKFVKQATAFQQEVNKEQNKAMQGVLNQLNEIISGIAKKNSYSLVLDAQAVVYANDGTDITKQVAKEFDKK